MTRGSALRARAALLMILWLLAGCGSSHANGSSAQNVRASERQTDFVNTGAELPPYEVSDFAPVGARTAWALTFGNQIRNQSQSVQRSGNGGADWLNVAPHGFRRGGRLRNLSSIDVLDPVRAWIDYGSIEGGRQSLLVTADGGRTWIRAGRTPPHCDVQFVNRLDGWCVEIDGALGSEFVRIYRTTTAGRAWRQVSRNDPPGQPSTRDPIPFGCDKSVMFTSPTDGFASSTCNGGGGFIYATTDGGSRWHRRLSLPASVGESGGEEFTAVVASGRNDAVGYTVHGRTRSTSVVYHSVDDGLRWTRIRPPGRPRDYDVDIVTPRVWRLATSRTVLDTDNAGRTWTRIIANVALSRASQVLFTTTDVGWDIPLGGVSDSVLRTTDGGRHWTTVHVPQ